MKKSLIWSFVLLLVQVMFASCSESEEANIYDNWQQRNDDYIESIKDKALANVEGNWLVVKDYSYQRDDSATIFNGTTSQYVYAQVLKRGDSTESPNFTDSVYVSYCGQLMPYVDEDGVLDTVTFEKTFYANPVDVFETKTDTVTIKTLAPTKMALSGLCTGFSSALLHMHKGDVWKVYIPYELGYGSTAKTSIPAYSSLVFYIYLQGFYPVGTTVPDWR